MMDFSDFVSEGLWMLRKGKLFKKGAVILRMMRTMRSPGLAFNIFHTLGVCQVYGHDRDHDRPSPCPQGVDIPMLKVVSK